MINNLINSDPLDGITINESSKEAGWSGMLAIITETEINYNNIMNNVYYNELSEFIDTKREPILESGNISGFFNKFKELLKSLYSKIASLFQKFLAKINALVMDDKDFVSKYKERLAKIKTSKMKYKGFNFTFPSNLGSIEVDNIMDPNNTIDEAIANKSIAEFKKLDGEKAKDYIDKYVENNTKVSDDYDDYKEIINGKFVNSTASFTNDELSTELFEILRDGEKDKTALDNIDLMDQLGYITSTVDAKKAVEKDLKAIKKSINKVIKNLDSLEKTLSKNIYDKDAEVDNPGINKLTGAIISKVSMYNKTVKHILACNQKVLGAKMTAYKQRNRQAKDICAKALTHTESTSSSFGSTDTFNEDGNWGSVKLI